MRRIVIQDPRHIHPFNEPARDLRVHNVPLWLWQRDRLSQFVREEREYPDWQMAKGQEENENVAALVHRDNQFFNERLVRSFLRKSKAENKPFQLAFKVDDPSILEHVLPLTRSIKKEGALYLAEFWY